MDNHGDRGRFLRLVQAGIDSAERLLEALELEHRALRAGDTDRLGESTGAKESLLREMQQRTHALDRFLAAQGLPAGKAGGRAFLDTLPEDAEEHRLWHRLRQAADSCRDHNEINGGILAASRARVQRSLEILRGISDTAKTYGKAGQTHHGGYSKVLGKV